jgi:hypothetical protein
VEGVLKVGRCINPKHFWKPYLKIETTLKKIYQNIKFIFYPIYQAKSTQLWISGMPLSEDLFCLKYMYCKVNILKYLLLVSKLLILIFFSFQNNRIELTHQNQRWRKKALPLC